MSDLPYGQGNFYSRKISVIIFVAEIFSHPYNASIHYKEVHKKPKMNYAENILDLVGNTPLVKLNRVSEEFSLRSSIFAKLERDNPTGSIKDRAAKGIIQKGLDEGTITKDSVIVEPTSGNTGISVAAISTSLGIRCVLFMPSSCSIERVKIMKALGADVHLVAGGMPDAVREANEYIASHEGAILFGQFVNEANPRAHYETTGPEIWRQLDGQVDVFISAFGTGGTLTGVGRYLKEQNKDIEIIGVEPATSPFISKGEKGAHKIQGIGAGFKPDVLGLETVDRILTVTSEEAYEYAKILASKEGLFVGISSGANVAVAVRLAKEEKYQGKNIVTVLPDNGERYLSVDGLF